MDKNELILQNLFGINRPKNRPLTAYLSVKNQTVLSLFVFDPRNVKNHRRYDITNVSDFVKNLEEFCKQNVGVFILNVFDFNHPDFPHNIVFCQELIQTLSLNYMAFHFVTNEIVTFTSLLIAANITPKIANDILIITVQENSLNVVELQGFNEWWIVKRKIVSCEEDENDPKKFCSEILEDVTPLKIIILNMKSTPKRDKTVETLKATLPSKMLLVFEKFKWDACKTVQEFTKSCQNCDSRTPSPYLITPQSCRYFIAGKINSTKERGFFKDDILLQYNVHIDVPQTGMSETGRSVSRSHKKFYIGILSSDKETCFMLPPFEAPKEQCHQYDLCLEINHNNDPVLYASGIMLEQIENLPVTLTNTVKTKVPVIEFFDNSSVICVWNKKRNCYEFAKKWNGVFGKDLFLSFENATPKLTDKFAKNRSFIVYDVLQLLAAVPDENISIDSDWEFKVISNEKENDTVMVEYETHSAKKATSTPSHLMNLLLKEHFKVIKEETGGDLTEFGIYISGCCWFASKARKILEKRFAEICENMKVKCEFIKFC